MTWYYALGNERQGPVDDTALDRLVATGVVTPDTLVWKAGMADWLPLSLARPRVAAPAPVLPPPPAAFGAPGGYGAPGGGFGAAGWSQPASTGPETADQIYARVVGANRRIDIGRALGRGWEVVAENAGLAIGGTVIWTLCYLAGFVPCLGIFPRLFVNPSLQAGVYRLMLKLHRGEPAEFGDAFSVFSTSFLQLLLYGFVSVIVAFICTMPYYALSWSGSILGARSSGDAILLLPLFGVLLVLPPLIYVSVSWVFAPLLIVDKGLDFWPAMELSRKVAAKHFFPVFGLLIVCALIFVAGVVALCLGIFVAAPFALASIAVAYDDLFGRA